MKILIRVLLIVLLVSSHSFATRYIHQDTVQDQYGNLVNGATITVYLAGGSTLATIYAAGTGAADGDSAVSTDANGTYTFWVDDEDYSHHQKFKTVISFGAYTGDTWDNLQIFPDSRRTLANDSSTNQGDSSTHSTLAWHIDDLSGAKSEITVLTGTHDLSTDVSVPATINLIFEEGGMIKPSSTDYELTIYHASNIVASPTQQIIDATSNTSDPLLFTVGGDDSSPIRPHWLGIDGTADEVQINLAITAKEDDSVIELSPATYTISNSISLIGDNMKLKGYGSTVTQASVSDISMVLINRPSVNQIIEGITLDGNGNNQTIDVDIITDSGTGSPVGLKILNCVFVEAKYTAINVDNVQNGLIDGNSFDDSEYGHIRWHSCDNSVISNNHFTTDIGNYSYMALSLDGRGNTVIGNTFDKIPTGSYAIRFLADGTNPVRGNKIIGNKFDGDSIASYAISFDDTTYTTDNIISNNEFYSCFGINAAGPRTKVVNNSFVDTGRPWYPSGTDLQIVFSNNTVSGASAGLRLKYTDGVVANNIFYNIGTTAILMEGTTNAIIEGNIFRNIGVDDDDTHAVIDLEYEGTTESTYNIIKGNIISSDDANTPSAFIDTTFDPANNQVVNNIIQNTHETLLWGGSTDPDWERKNDVRNNTDYTTNNHIQTYVITLTAAEVKTLGGASGQNICPSPGADKIIEFVSATIALNYSGTGNWAEASAPDDLVIQYNTSGVDVTDSIDATGFIDQTNDELRWVVAKDIKDTDLISSVNNSLHLYNTGDEYTESGGTPTSTLIVTVNYRIHETGL